MRDGEMLAAASCDLAPGLEDWRSFLGRDLGKHDPMRSPPQDEGLSARCTDVSHPLRTVPEHRDEVALALVRRGYEYGCAQAPTASPLHLQRDQDSRRQAKSGHPGPGPAHNPSQPGRAPVAIEEAQVTASLSWISARCHRRYRVKIEMAEDLSANHLICSQQDGLGDREAECFGGPQIDDQQILRRLLDGQL